MKINEIIQKLKEILTSKLLKNSFWGIAANGIQTVLLSLFFIITARKYSTSEFALFLIATSLYQFLAAFSTLGLGQWFTREMVHSENKQTIIIKFLKIQFISGLFFYAVNIILAFILYSDSTIQHLAIILGINIIFDNSIYAIRSLNVAEFQQKKSFTILSIDSLLKFSASCLLFIYPLPIVTLSVILIVIRFITLNFFLNFGSSDSINIKQLWKSKISFTEVKHIVFNNWPFIIIGSVSIIFWRIGNLIISKTLTLADVANYEVSYRIFSIALILPLIFSTSVFPSLVSVYNSGNRQKLTGHFHKLFALYFIYSLLTYTFFYSFSDAIIPFAFGEKYLHNAVYTKQMFLTILVFPTALLQANVLVAVRMEKADMWLNIISLIVSVLFCVIGLSYYKSLTVVNLAIFTSFFIFHLFQDGLLIKYKVTTLGHVLKFYIITGALVGIYILLSDVVQPVWLYPGFWGIVLLFFGFMILKRNQFSDYFRNLKSAD